MVYGDGFAAADDVVGHELTHGVTDFSSHLFYYQQSGAINESMSDVFGEFIDLTNAPAPTRAAVRWKLGEDVPRLRRRSATWRTRGAFRRPRPDDQPELHRRPG